MQCDSCRCLPPLALGTILFQRVQQPREEGRPAVDDALVAADVPCPYGFPGVSVENAPAKGTGFSEAGERYTKDILQVIFTSCHIDVTPRFFTHSY